MSLSREFAAFVADLQYGDLPAAVVDRAKGVTLQALSSALVARDMPASRQALALMQEEEAGGGGAATVLCHGAQADQGRRGLRQCRDDLRRRQVGHVPHADPSRHRDPAGRAGRGGDDAACSGKEFLTGVAAGYEVMERMAAEFIPTRDVARLSRRAGVRHFRRGGRGGEDRRASTRTR